MGEDELEVYEMGIKPRSCAQFAPEYKFAPGSNLHPGANLQPLMSRSYANKLCPCTPKFD